MPGNDATPVAASGVIAFNRGMDHAPPPQKRRRPMAWIVLLLAVAVPVLAGLLLVEDWSRDLTTNTAATRAGHPDERLRPIEIDATGADLQEAARAFCAEHQAWTVGDARPLPGDSPLAPIDATQRVHLVRSTRLIGFRDDVWALLEPMRDGRVRLHAESRSRVGKGDLGQNPRNLRELLPALAGRLSR